MAPHASRPRGALLPSRALVVQSQVTERAREAAMSTVRSDSAAQAETAAVAARMAEAAAGLLGALTPEQRARATFDFPAEHERRRWFYTPTDHGGLPLGEMNPVQQQRTLRLVSTGLSEPGFVTAATIIGLE